MKTSTAIFAMTTVFSVASVQAKDIAPTYDPDCIAHHYFGMPEEYGRILEENRDTLQSPEEIQIGQRLIIPS